MGVTAGQLSERQVELELGAVRRVDPLVGQQLGGDRAHLVGQPSGQQRLAAVLPELARARRPSARTRRPPRRTASARPAGPRGRRPATPGCAGPAPPRGPGPRPRRSGAPPPAPVRHAPTSPTSRWSRDIRPGCAPPRPGHPGCEHRGGRPAGPPAPHGAGQRPSRAPQPRRIRQRARTCRPTASATERSSSRSPAAGPSVEGQGSAERGPDVREAIRVPAAPRQLPRRPELADGLDGAALVAQDDAVGVARHGQRPRVDRHRDQLSSAGRRLGRLGDGQPQQGLGLGHLLAAGHRRPFPLCHRDHYREASISCCRESESDHDPNARRRPHRDLTTAHSGPVRTSC